MIPYKNSLYDSFLSLKPELQAWRQKYLKTVRGHRIEGTFVSFLRTANVVSRPIR